MLKRYIIFLFTLLPLISCSPDNDTQKTISEQQMVRILVDIHLTDATLTSQNIYSSRNNYLPSYYYNSIFQKHGISSAQFDSCITYYGQNSKLFNQLYSKVIDSLNRLETKIQIELKRSLEQQDTINLWNQSDTIILPGEDFSLAPFNIPITDTGVYKIKAQIKIFMDDQTTDPQIRAYFWKDNGTAQGDCYYFDSIPLIHDGKFHEYEADLKLPDTTFTHIRGDLLYGTNEESDYNQHAEIINILIFNPGVKTPDQSQIRSDILP